jgi:hypothetical protein
MLASANTDDSHEFEDDTKAMSHSLHIDGSEADDFCNDDNDDTDIAQGDNCFF